MTRHGGCLPDDARLEPTIRAHAVRKMALGLNTMLDAWRELTSSWARTLAQFFKRA